MRLLSNPKVQKFLILSLYGIVGAAVQAGYLPPSAKTFLSEHSLELLFLAFGLGHVAPEAARK